MNQKTKALLKKLRSESACDRDALLRYFYGDMAQSEKKTMDAHLDTCPACLEILALLREEAAPIANTEWAAVEKRMDDRVYAHLERAAGKKGSGSDTWLDWLRKILPAPAPAVAYVGLLIIFSIAGVYGLASLNRPPTFELAHVTVASTALTRGVETDDTFLTAVEHLNNKNYRAASQAFTDFLRQKPDDFQGHFYLGLTKLMQAEEKILWVRSGFEPRLVEEGIGYLKTAYQLTGDNPFFREDCLWYLGKAYLMLGNKEAAIEQFETIIGLPDENILRKEKAREMVEAIGERK